MLKIIFAFVFVMWLLISTYVFAKTTTASNRAIITFVMKLLAFSLASFAVLFFIVILF